MKYLCLRDCYVGEMFRRKGDIYDLPDGMEKSPKNFKLVEEEVVAPSTPEKSPEPKTGEYLCSKCHSIHKESSKLGLRHLKYKAGV